MTIQSNPSPFSSDIKNKNASDNFIEQMSEENFEIRTMKEDLAKIQAGEIKEEKKVNTVTAPFKSVEKAIETTIETQPAPKTEPAIQAESPIKIKPFQPESLSATENTKKMEEIEVPIEKVTSNNPSKITKIVVFFVLILVIAIASLGGYYFFLTKNADLSLNTPSTENTEVTPTPTNDSEPDNEPKTSKYLEEKPNLLPIDINNVESSEINTEILKVADELKDTTMKSPYEFIIVDANNNPISFPIFATAAKINFSQALLASLGNDFSFYLYNDNSKMRAGLSIEIANKEALIKELPNQEKTFFNNASLLFLNNSVETENNLFNSSTFDSYSIRYSNANVAKDLSIDYTTTDKKLIIGSSQNTLRSILTKTNNNVISGNDDDSSEVDINTKKEITTSQLDSNLAQ